MMMDSEGHSSAISMDVVLLALVFTDDVGDALLVQLEHLRAHLFADAAAGAEVFVDIELHPLYPFVQDYDYQLSEKRPRIKESIDPGPVSLRLMYYFGSLPQYL